MKLKAKNTKLSNTSIIAVLALSPAVWFSLPDIFLYDYNSTNATLFDQDDFRPPMYEETTAEQMEEGDGSEEEDGQKEPSSEPTRFGWIQGVMVCATERLENEHVCRNICNCWSYLDSLYYCKESTNKSVLHISILYFYSSKSIPVVEKMTRSRKLSNSDCYWSCLQYSAS